ncbi:MAG: VOC family protein [Geodermatophilaceae bacterium]|nr:VOC family protein [Geodermatophilaceae bacterium]
MERVLGIGGLFVRAEDPAALGGWYADNLGVPMPPESYGEPSWWQHAGPTVFAAMDDASGHFGRPAQTWAVNFRVRDLDAMVDQLRRAGVVVRVNSETYPNGRFADLHDPERNPVQLWEPAGGDLLGPDG